MSYDWLERSEDSEVESGHQCVTVDVEIVGVYADMEKKKQKNEKKTKKLK